MDYNRAFFIYIINRHVVALFYAAVNQGYQVINVDVISNLDQKKERSLFAGEPQPFL